MQFTFIVDGEPIAQPRHSAGKNPRTGETQMYLPKKHPIHAYRQAVTIAARLAKPPGWNNLAPIGLTIEFFIRRPQDGPVRFHTATPDASNCLKGAEDAITAAGGVWADDCQITALSVRKYSVGKSDKPFTRVTVADLSMHIIPSCILSD